MAIARGLVRFLAVGLVVLAVAATGLGLFLTRTDYGVEQAGRLVLRQLEGSINGSVTVGRVASASLLEGVTLHDVELRDAAGRPFVQADSARLSYGLRTLLRGSVVFERLMVFGPRITIERLPGDQDWNYDRLFADTSAAPDTTASQGLVLIRDATIRNGEVIVRFPWDADAATDTSRLILESVPGGRVRTLRFQEVDARLPRIVWESPESEGRIVEIDRLAMRAHIWETPLEVRELVGVVTIQDSVIGFEADRVRLPDSELRLDGEVVVGADGERYDVEATATRVAFRDFQWLHPPLPDDGGGSLRFRLQTQERGTTLWLARDAELATGGSELTGSFGVVMGGPLRFRDVDVRATPLDLDLLDRLLPGGVPLSGLVIGSIQANGPVTALDTRGDVRYRTFDPEGSGAESAVRWDGTLGLDAPYVLRNMEAELRSVDLVQVAQLAPALRLRGIVQGTLRVDGSLQEGARVRGDLALTQDSMRSAVQGSGRVAFRGTPMFDLFFDAQPVALELLAQQVPALEGLRGEARGPVTVVGSLDDLSVDIDLSTPAGAVVVEGGLALTGPRRWYRAEGSVTEFRLDRVVAGLPETLVTARFDLDGSGFELAQMESQVSADLLSAAVGGVDVYRGTLRGRVANGLARVDSLSIATEVGDAGAQGTFGLVEDRAGELAVSLRADSLMFLESLLFPDVPPLDAELEQTPRVDGTVIVDGHLNGSLVDWRANGMVRIRSLLYDDLELGRGRLDLAWQRDSLRVEASMDSLRFDARRLASARAVLTYTAGLGLVAANIEGRRGQQLDVESAFEPEGDVVNLGLRRLRLTTRDGEWELADTAQATVGREGFQVDSLVLVRSPTTASIRVAGVLPWRPVGADEVQEAALSVDVDSVRIGEFLRVTQTDTLVDGIVTGSVRVTGTALAPRVVGRLSARSFRYGGAVLDSLRAEVAYADQAMDGSITGWEEGAAIITGQARVPIELALTDRADRWLDRPMDVRFHADGVPAGLLSFLAAGFTDVEGRVQGDLALVGTPVEPDLQAALELTDGAAYFQPLAVRYRNVQVSARMTEGSVMELDADLTTENGRGQVRGTLDLVQPADPVFDLTVNAQRLDASRRRDVTAIVNGQAQVSGRYTRPVVSGDMRVVRGEMNLDEIWRQHQIVQLDTSLFQMLDTTEVSYRPTPENPFLRNLRITNTTVSTNRNFWLRSEELNVEVAGELAVEVDRQTEDLRLTGTLEVVEGNYQLLARDLPSGRRFEIRDGSIEFVGTPGIDPNLDIEAAYRVRRPRGDPINVLAEVSGTLQDPRVHLTSDAEILMSETDLASYIIFGRAGAELTQAEMDVAAGGALGLAAGLFRPVVSGAASTGFQQVATSLGLPVDYVAFSLPDYGTVGWQQTRGALGLFQNAQIEVGFDLSSRVSAIGSVRVAGGDPGDDRPSALRLSGARIEYRPWLTWTIEGFVEDQFARRPSFGAAEISDRKVLGLSLFREWGY